MTILGRCARVAVVLLLAAVLLLATACAGPRCADDGSGESCRHQCVGERVADVMGPDAPMHAASETIPDGSRGAIPARLPEGVSGCDCSAACSCRSRH